VCQDRAVAGLQLDELRVTVDELERRSVSGLPVGRHAELTQSERLLMRIERIGSARPSPPS
jgi:hypothetical protein